MKRRISIPMKLALAASPVMAAVGVLLALTVRTSVDDAREARRSADIVAIWTPLNAAVDAADVERGRNGDADVSGANEATTDGAIAELAGAIAKVDSPAPLEAELQDARDALAQARAAKAAGSAGTALAYDEVDRDLRQLGTLLSGVAGDPEVGRDLQSLASLLAARQGIGRISDTVAAGVRGEPIDLLAFAVLIDDTKDSISGFVAAAPIEWLQAWNDTDLASVLTANHDQYLQIITGPVEDIPSALARTSVTDYRKSDREISTLFTGFTGSITAGADADEDAARTAAWRKVAGAGAAALLATIVSGLVIHSITRRIRRVAAHARDVATTQLPTLVEALRDPRGRVALPRSRTLQGAGHDEVGELADAFNTMQDTLVDVADEQMQVLRRGVSDIFVTLARRNRSLVDRQLALLDELEADVDDPEVLGDYFKLDHLATRMRRNAESLLVLARTDPKHRRQEALPVDDVVRAAISEVEEYRRIEVLALEPLTVKGSAAGDLSHLIAELLDNAAAFSPPGVSVQVAGRFVNDGYALTITDQGMGIEPERLAELNDLLETPPVIGLSVEPTLGLSVVSLLAHKHQLRVTLAASSTGTTAHIVLGPPVFDRGPELEAAAAAASALAPARTPSPSRAAPPAMSLGTSGLPVRQTASRGPSLEPIVLPPEEVAAVELAVTMPAPAPRLRRTVDWPSSSLDLGAPRAIPPQPSAPDPTRADAPPPPAAAPPAAVPPPATSPPRPSPVTTGGALPTRPVAARADASPTSAPAPTAAAAPTMSPTAGPPPIGRPLLEGFSTSAGLPLRVPGGATPDVGGDERSVAVSRPDQVRVSLAAFTRGMSAGSAGATLADTPPAPEVPAP